jgi:hypothetical protein
VRAFYTLGLGPLSVGPIIHTPGSVKEPAAERDGSMGADTGADFALSFPSGLGIWSMVFVGGWEIGG